MGEALSPCQFSQGGDLVPWESTMHKATACVQVFPGDTSHFLLGTRNTLPENVQDNTVSWPTGTKLIRHVHWGYHDLPSLKLTVCT